MSKHELLERIKLWLRPAYHRFICPCTQDGLIHVYKSNFHVTTGRDSIYEEFIEDCFMAVRFPDHGEVSGLRVCNKRGPQ